MFSLTLHSVGQQIFFLIKKLIELERERNSNVEDTKEEKGQNDNSTEKNYGPRSLNIICLS